MKFGFNVEKINEKWRVYLPHQCDEWDIATDDWDGVDHEEAVANLEVFIEEAKQALEALKSKQDCDSGHLPTIISAH